MDNGKTVEQILDERAKTHGSFAEVAETEQAIKAILERKADIRSDSQNCALGMIAMKLARIINGNAYATDHWKDIAGYALLVERELEAMFRE
jgi:hypothetical protein